MKMLGPDRLPEPRTTKKITSPLYQARRLLGGRSRAARAAAHSPGRVGIEDGSGLLIQ